MNNKRCDRRLSSQVFVFALYLCNAQPSHGVEESSLANVIH